MTAAKRPEARAKPGRAALPVVDLQRFLDAFKLPGVDVKSIADARRAEMRAVALANRRAHDGMRPKQARRSAAGAA